MGRGNPGATLGTATIQVEVDLSKLDSQFAEAQRKTQAAAGRLSTTLRPRTALDPQTLVAELNAAERAVATHADNIGNSFDAGSRRGRFALQNLAFQVQDFVVQVSSGQGVLRAFAQQIPQAFIGFGATGVIIGTVVSAVAALGGALLGLSRSSKETEADLREQQAELKRLEEQYKAAAGAARDYTEAQSVSVRSEIKTDIPAQLKQATEDFRSAIENLQRFASAGAARGIEEAAGLEQLIEQYKAGTISATEFRLEVERFAASSQAPPRVIEHMRNLAGQITDAGERFARFTHELGALDAGVSVEGLADLRAELNEVNAELADFGHAPPAGTEERKRFDDFTESLHKASLTLQEFLELRNSTADTGLTAEILLGIDVRDLQRQADAIDDLEKKIFALAGTTDQAKIPEKFRAILQQLADLRQEVAKRAGEIKIGVAIPAEDTQKLHADVERITNTVDALPSKKTLRINVEATGLQQLQKEAEDLERQLSDMQLSPPPAAGSEARRRYDDMSAALDKLKQSRAEFASASPEVQDAVNRLVDDRAAVRQEENITTFERKILDLRNAIIIADLPTHFQAAAKAAADAGQNLATGDWGGASEDIQQLAGTVGHLQSQLEQTQFGRKLADMANEAKIANLPPQLRDAAKAAQDFGFMVGDVKPDAIVKLGAAVTRIQQEFREGRLADQIREINNQAIVLELPDQHLKDFAEALSRVGVDLSELKSPEDLDAELAKLSDTGKQVVDDFVAAKETLRSAQLADAVNEFVTAARRARVPELFQEWAQAAQRVGATISEAGDVDLSLVKPEDVQRLEEMRRQILDLEGHKIELKVEGLERELKISQVPDELKVAARYALETRQYLDAAGNVDFSQMPADLKAASRETARISKALEDAGRIEAGGRLPDRIDVANIAAGELANTLSDIGSIDFSNMDEAFSSLGNALTNITQQIIQAIIQALIFRAIMSAFGTPGAPAQAGAGAGGAPIPLFPGGLFAQGGVLPQTGGGPIIYRPFAQGGIMPRTIAAGLAAAAGGPITYQPFAMGGRLPRLITGPTTFAAGGSTIMAGEAGPEAILPLARTTSGHLGVRVAEDHVRQAAPPGVAVPAEADVGALLKQIILSLVGSALSGLVAGDLAPFAQAQTIPRGTGPIVYRPLALGALMPRTLVEYLGGAGSDGSIIYQPYALGGLLPRAFLPAPPAAQGAIRTVHERVTEAGALERTIMGPAGVGTAAAVYQPFALGGPLPRMIMGPTTFAAGGTTIMAGEAGPEAIVPLERSASGKLGLRLEQPSGQARGGGTVIFNIPDARPDTVAFALNQARRVFPNDTVEVMSRSPASRQRAQIEQAPF